MNRHLTEDKVKIHSALLIIREEHLPDYGIYFYTQHQIGNDLKVTVPRDGENVEEQET